MLGDTRFLTADRAEHAGLRVIITTLLHLAGRRTAEIDVLMPVDFAERSFSSSSVALGQTVNITPSSLKRSVGVEM